MFQEWDDSDSYYHIEEISQIGFLVSLIKIGTDITICQWVHR